VTGTIGDYRAFCGTRSVFREGSRSKAQGLIRESDNGLDDDLN
jgi:hypothetical protein